MSCVFTYKKKQFLSVFTHQTVGTVCLLVTQFSLVNYAVVCSVYSERSVICQVFFQIVLRIYFCIFSHHFLKEALLYIKSYFLDFQHFGCFHWNKYFPPSSNYKTLQFFDIIVVVIAQDQLHKIYSFEFSWLATLRFAGFFFTLKVIALKQCKKQVLVLQVLSFHEEALLNDLDKFEFSRTDTFVYALVCIFKSGFLQTSFAAGAKMSIRETLTMHIKKRNTNTCRQVQIIQ